MLTDPAATAQVPTVTGNGIVLGDHFCVAQRSGEAL